jgi:response regulator RpfG family c-di-GMP phosphodiesterase
MSQTTPGDEFVFTDEDEALAPNELAKWKVLLADDEEDVHVATKFVLKDFIYKNRGIAFLDAYSGDEACRILRANPDIAVVFLDVVMETDDAGLRAVKRIREELENSMVRIILRTGQPGHAPEEHVVLNYHINDYKSKSEMTTQKLFTSIVSALRSFEDLQTIETSRRGLTKILDAVGNVDFHSRNLFVSGLMMQMGLLLDMSDNDIILVRRSETRQEDKILAACGNFDPFIGDVIKDVLDPVSIAAISGAFAQQTHHLSDKFSIYHVPLAGLGEVVVYVAGTRRIADAEFALIDIFCQKIVLACDNYEYVEQSRRDQTVELAMLAMLADHAHIATLQQTVDRARLASDIARNMIDTGIPGTVGPRLPDILVRAAMLTDIGNHRVATEILTTPGPLSAEQTAQMRQHTRLGSEIIKEATVAQGRGGQVIDMASAICRTHHEAVDGSGYPRGLMGSEIPLASRIVAVADGYIAMTSPRPWRPALSHDAAMAIIQAEAGKKYDTQVVEGFLQISDAYRTA